MTTNDHSLEIVIVFFSCFFVILTCGIFRALKNFYRRKTVHNHNRHVIAHRNILIAHIDVPPQPRTRNPLQRSPSVVITSVAPSSPPPYTPRNELPPTYDEAIHIPLRRSNSLPNDPPPSYRG